MFFCFFMSETLILNQRRVEGLLKSSRIFRGDFFMKDINRLLSIGRALFYSAPFAVLILAGPALFGPVNLREQAFYACFAVLTACLLAALGAWLRCEGKMLFVLNAINYRIESRVISKELVVSNYGRWTEGDAGMVSSAGPSIFGELKVDRVDFVFRFHGLVSSAVAVGHRAIVDYKVYEDAWCLMRLQIVSEEGDHIFTSGDMGLFIDFRNVPKDGMAV